MAKLVALDTNLLILLVVGLTDTKYIASHKRLREYTTSDFYILQKFIVESKGVIVTPNVLTEASNLLRQTQEPAKSRISRRFKELISKLQEKYIPSAQASSRDEFIRLGLSDAALLQIEQDDIVLLSTDLDLYLAALAAGKDAINFNHHREL